MIKPPGQMDSQVRPIASATPIQRIGNDPGRLLVAQQRAAVQAPHFAVGEMVTARLAEPLGNRQWLAVVKDTPFSLQWPTSTAAKSGDPREAAALPASPKESLPTRGETLTLRVVSTSPRLTFVLADGPPPSVAAGAAAVQLSDAARKLSALIRAADDSVLQGRGAAPDAASVLLTNPGAAPLLRAQALAQAIRQSGLFYESHVAAWGEGRLPLEGLRGEPQSRAGEALRSESSAARDAANAELGQLVQRQLDALDGKPLSFSGFAWPGQRADWQIQRESGEAHSDEDDDPDPPRNADAPATWTTQLHLSLPRLGALGAHLRVTGSQVALVMTSGNEATAGLLDAHRERLQSALQRVGLTLTALEIERAATELFPAAPEARP